MSAKQASDLSMRFNWCLDNIIAKKETPVTVAVHFEEIYWSKMV